MPFLTAKRIDVSLAWEAMFRREVLVDSIEMTDWHMVLEQWAGGKHSFPKFNMGGGEAEAIRHDDAVRADKGGTVTFDDHGSRWGAVARNLDITVTKFAGYRGEATFHGGTVWIQDYVPMSMSMKAVFRVEDGNVHFERMMLTTDGAESNITGDADIPNWPEMTYQVKSTVDFKRMRELFFAKDNYTLSGEGRFNGIFHLFKGGRALTGDFESDVAGLQIGGHDYEFPDLKGKLGWFPNRFEVTDTTTGFYGGEAKLKYSILSSAESPASRRTPTSTPSGTTSIFRPTATSCGCQGCASRADGAGAIAGVAARPFPRACRRRLLRSGSAGRRRGAGGYRGERVRERARRGRLSSRPGPPADRRAGDAIATTGDWVEFSDGRFSTPATDVTFSGRTAWGDDSRIPFQVTSADLQESDRVLAGMMTAFGAPTNADYGRGNRRVLRRHDRVARPAARRRALRRRRHARVRRQLGKRRSGPRHSELVRRRHRRPHAERRR